MYNRIDRMDKWISIDNLCPQTRKKLLVISGSQAIIALCMPMAMTAFPDGGLPILVMLMSVAWAAMQISPTHVCTFVAAEYYHTTFNDVAVKGIVSVVLFSILSYGYAHLMMLFL